MKPGIYQLAASQYHADAIGEGPSLSHSIAKILVEQSPLHAWTAHPRLNPNYKSKDKKEFDLGSAAHAALFEGEAGIVVVPFDDWRKADAQKLREQARAEGKYPVLTAKYDDVMKMREAAIVAIDNCADLSGLNLRAGRAEHTLVWVEGGPSKHDPLARPGVLCRARLDFLFAGELVFLDYKTTEDAAPASFSGRMVKMAYHLQDDFYARGVHAVFGKRPRGIFMAQEVTAPYACSFHACAASTHALARKDNDYARALWSQCLRTGQWPSHDNRIHYAETKTWDHEDQEVRLLGNPYKVEQLWEKPAREEAA